MIHRHTVPLFICFLLLFIGCQGQSEDPGIRDDDLKTGVGSLDIYRSASYCLNICFLVCWGWVFDPGNI